MKQQTNINKLLRNFHWVYVFFHCNQSEPEVCGIRGHSALEQHQYQQKHPHITVTNMCTVLDQEL